VQARPRLEKGARIMHPAGQSTVPFIRNDPLNEHTSWIKKPFENNPPRLLSLEIISKQHKFQ
jgi:hypothetical protein